MKRVLFAIVMLALMVSCSPSHDSQNEIVEFDSIALEQGFMLLDTSLVLLSYDSTSYVLAEAPVLRGRDLVADSSWYTVKVGQYKAGDTIERASDTLYRVGDTLENQVFKWSTHIVFKKNVVCMMSERMLSDARFRIFVDGRYIKKTMPLSGDYYSDFVDAEFHFVDKIGQYYCYELPYLEMKELKNWVDNINRIEVFHIIESNDVSWDDQLFLNKTYFDKEQYEQNMPLLKAHLLSL